MLIVLLYLVIVFAYILIIFSTFMRWMTYSNLVAEQRFSSFIQE